MSPRLIIGGGLLCLLAVVAGLALASGRAEAHGVQVVSEPPPNAQLLDSPETITVTFSEPIEPAVSTIQLWDQAGERVPLGQLEFFDDPKKMAVQVSGDLPPAIYTVIWRNLSTVDGHIWSGSFPITILTPAGQVPGGEAFDAAPVLGQAASDTPSTLESAARWVVLLGSAIMLGGAAYVLFVVFPAARILAPESGAALRSLSRTVLLVTGAIAVFLVLEGSLLQLLVQANRLGGLGQADDLLVDTRFGRYLIARQGLLAIALLALALVWRARGSRGATPALGLLLAASLGVLLTQSLVSHAAASDGPFWTTSIDLLHLLAASLWVGGLIHIGLAMPRWLDALQGVPRTLFAAESFRRFSALAAFSVIVLLASGVLSALVQFTSWDELWSTSYGWSLVGKMAVMLPLLAVAALNAFSLQPRVVEAGLHVAGGAGPEDDVPGRDVGRLQRRLANTVRAEAVLGIVVLVAVAVLIQLQSPRTTADAAEQAAAQAAAAQAAADQAPDPADKGYFQDAVEVDELIVALRIEPGEVGQNRFSMGLGTEFGFIGEVLQDGVRLEFEHEREDVPTSSLQLPLAGSALYGGEGGFLNLPGEWTITVNIQRRGLDDVRAAFEIDIPDPSAAEGENEPADEPAESKSESESIWQWPFDGARSAGAIGVLAGTAVVIVGWGALRRFRRAG